MNFPSLILFCALIFPLSVLADTGLAIVTRDATVAGKLVKDAQPVQAYAVPKAGDYVRVADVESNIWITGVWEKWPVVVGHRYEVCASDTSKESWANATCTLWQLTTPTALSKTGTIVVTWETPLDSVPSGYRLYSGVAGSTLTLLASPTAAELTKTLRGYGNGKYDFAISAMYGDVESVRTGPVSVEVIIPVPVITNPPKSLSITSVTIE